MALPLFELVIDPNDHSGVTAIALVDRPAIEFNWQAFSEQKAFKFEAVDKEKRIIAGPLMVANQPIYRNDERGEYNCYFSGDTIEQIRFKFHKNQYEHRANPMHESMMLLPDVFMVSDFSIDRARGIMPPLGYEKLTNQSWWGELKVDNDEVWNDFVKTGLFKGFSVEGFFKDIPADLTDADLKKLSKFLIHFQ